MKKTVGNSCIQEGENSLIQRVRAVCVGGDNISAGSALNDVCEVYKLLRLAFFVDPLCVMHWRFVGMILSLGGSNTRPKLCLFR